MLQKIDNLIGNAKDPAKLQGRFYDIDQMMPKHEQMGDKSLAITARMNQIQLSYCFGRYQEALALAAKRTPPTQAPACGACIFPCPTVCSIPWDWPTCPRRKKDQKAVAASGR